MIEIVVIMIVATGTGVIVGFACDGGVGLFGPSDTSVGDCRRYTILWLGTVVASLEEWGSW